MIVGMFLAYLILAFGCLFIALFDKVTKDIMIKIVFTIITFILFASLAIQSLNIEERYYNIDTGTFVSDTMANNGLEFMLPMGVCLIFSIFMLIHLFDMIPTVWNKNFNNKDIPKFQKFNLK